MRRSATPVTLPRSMLKRFKGFTTLFQYLLIGVELVVISLVTNLDPMAIGIIVGVGTIGGSLHSALATLCTLGAKGKAVEIATSVYTGATYVGEFLCGYVPAILSGMIFGQATPSNNLLVAGVAMLVLAVVSVPIGHKAYKLAFPDEA